TAPDDARDLLNDELREALASRPDADDPLTRTIWAILEAERNYVPTRTVYPGRITLFWADNAPRGFEDNRRGWRRLAARGLNIHVVPGTHTTIREEPNVGVLVEQLRPYLNGGRQP